LDEDAATAVERGVEATMFSGWIYDQLKPHAAELKVAHPLMLRAIAAAKKKNDRIDANKICDCLRCDFLPECYMAPTAIRERRRTLRYRNLLVRQMVQMKIKTSTLLMAQPEKWLIVPATPQSTATSSISTSASFGSPPACTVERAGAATGKYFAYTSFIAAKSSMSFRNTVVFTT
jgi:hypothetical protein